MVTIRSDNFDTEILEELGRRIRGLRLQQNLGQAELATLAHLSPTTVKNAERGRDPRLSTLVRILRVLGRVEALDAFLAPPTVSPLALLKTAGRVRERARARSQPPTSHDDGPQGG
jgi:transcriptional regulator with XRE-family HTH domain